jgi:hypothetical protein
MMFSGLRGPAPPGPPPAFFPGQPSPGFFPGAALAAALAAASSSASNGPPPPRVGSSPSNLSHIAPSPPSPSQLPQMYQNSGPGQALLSQWNAVHQAAAAHQAAFAAAVSAAHGKNSFQTASSPPLLPATSSSSTSPVLRHNPSLPIGFQRFSPYIIPPMKRPSPSPPGGSDVKRGSPISSSSTPPASPPRT